MNEEPQQAGTHKWCLRFLNGTLKGRSIDLAMGHNTIGSSAECEVMLPASDAAPRHAVLTVGAVAVAFQRSGDAQVTINGAAMGPGRRGLVAGDVVGIGRVELELDRSAAPREADDQMFPSRMALEAELERRRRGASVSRPSALWAIAACVGLVAGALAWWLGGQLFPAGTGNRAGVELATVQHKVSDYPEVSAVSLTSGRVRVSGFVESGQRRDSLIAGLAEFSDVVELEVHAVEDIVEQARRFVGDPGISVKYVGQGKLAISGTSAEQDVYERIRRLRNDLHPVVLVTDQVEYRESRAQNHRDKSSAWEEFQKSLPARVVSTTESGDGLNHIQLENGTRYYEGASTGNGSRISRIAADVITVAPASPR